MWGLFVSIPLLSCLGRRHRLQKMEPPRTMIDPNDKKTPLAWRMRPRDFSEFVGQEHLVAPGKFLRRAVEADRVSSLILFGPPGVGKTALAHLIAQYSKAVFSDLNAVTSGVAEIRQVIAEARKEKTASGRKTLLLIDEIHRFNKVQQS